MERLCLDCGTPVDYSGRGRPPSRCPSHSIPRNEYMREWYRKNAARLRKSGDDGSPRDCEHCGKRYQPLIATPSKFCSRKCKDKAKNAHARTARLTRKAQTGRLCGLCGGVVAPSLRVDAKFCSATCAAIAHGGLELHHRRKRAVVRQLVKRDGAKCAICGKRVAIDKPWPHRLSPSIDHVIPVSDGGSDAVANLRLTHLSCNCARGAGVGDGTQLALI